MIFTNNITIVIFCWFLKGETSEINQSLQHSSSQPRAIGTFAEPQKRAAEYIDIELLQQQKMYRELVGH